MRAQNVVLAHRPPISLPRTTVSPALLEELLSEVSSLASVYHKPAETFVGRGRIGADSILKGTGEYVSLSYVTMRATDLVPASATTSKSPKKRCKQSSRASKPRTSSTSTTRQQTTSSHQVSPRRLRSPPRPRRRTYSRVRRATRLTTLCRYSAMSAWAALLLLRRRTAGSAVFRSVRRQWRRPPCLQRRLCSRRRRPCRHNRSRRRMTCWVCSETCRVGVVVFVYSSATGTVVLFLSVHKIYIGLVGGANYKSFPNNERCKTTDNECNEVGNKRAVEVRQCVIVRI